MPVFSAPLSAKSVASMQSKSHLLELLIGMQCKCMQLEICLADPVLINDKQKQTKHYRCLMSGSFSDRILESTGAQSDSTFKVFYLPTTM